MATLTAVLRLNALSCIGFGAMFVTLPEMIGTFLGQMPPNALLLIGVALLGNGAQRTLASLRSLPLKPEIRGFSLGDLAWWIGSLALISTGTWITTPSGVMAAFGVALVVAGFAVALFRL